MTDQDTTQMPEASMPPVKRSERKAQENGLSDGPKYKALAMIAALVVVGFVTIWAVSSYASSKGKMPTVATGSSTTTATAIPVTNAASTTVEGAVIVNVDIPGFADVKKPHTSTWSKVRSNANSQLKAGRPAMWKAIFYENRDHFKDAAEAQKAVDWQIAREAKGYNYLVAIGKTNGEIHKIPFIGHPVPIWNTGPINNGMDYRRIRYTLTDDMFYLAWDPTNPYYHGEVQVGDGIKGNCLNVITARDVCIEVVGNTKPPCDHHEKPPKPPCNPKVTQVNPKDPGRTPGITVAEHNRVIENRGTEKSGSTGVKSSGNPATDQGGDSGGAQAPPPTGEVDPGPAGNEPPFTGNPGKDSN